MRQQTRLEDQTAEVACSQTGNKWAIQGCYFGPAVGENVAEKMDTESETKVVAYLVVAIYGANF